MRKENRIIIPENITGSSEPYVKWAIIINDNRFEGLGSELGQRHCDWTDPMWRGAQREAPNQSRSIIN